MTRRLPFFFSALLFATTTLNLSLAAGEPKWAGPEVPSKFVERLNQAGLKCNGGSSVGNDLVTCFAQYSGTSSLGGPGFSLHLNNLLACFEPYKKLLEACSTFPGRVNDLALIDAFKLAIANNGDLLEEIRRHNFGQRCRNRAEDRRIEQVLSRCVQEKIKFLPAVNLASSSRNNPLVVAEDFCSLAAAYKSCMTLGKNSNPCPEQLSHINFVLSIYERVVANSDHPDVMQSCVNG